MPYSSTYAVSIAHANYELNAWAFYFDDNYKLLPNVTISAGLRYELTPPWLNTLGQEFTVDLQTNNTPIAPNIGTQEPQNLWPFFRRQGNCTDPYEGVNVRWVGPTGAPVSPAPECANGQFPNRPHADRQDQLGASPGDFLHTDSYHCGSRGVRPLLQS